MPNQKQKSKGKSRLMKISEVMEELSVSRWMVEKLINEGVLHRKNIGRAVRVTRESLERFVENA